MFRTKSFNLLSIIDAFNITVVMVRVISCEGCQLAADIAKILGAKHNVVFTSRFANGESYVKLSEPVNNHDDIFIVQQLHGNIDTQIMNLLIMIDCCRLLNNINVIIPYYAYSRQDRPVIGESVTVALLARMIRSAGANRIFTVDIHNEHSLGFSDIPIINISSMSIFIDYFLKMEHKNYVFLSPDLGGFYRMKNLADKLSAPQVFFDKKNGRLCGDVSKYNEIIIVDDVVDTGKTVCECAEYLHNDHNHIFVFAAHALLSDNAIEIINKSYIEKVICLDTVPVRDSDKINVLSSAQLVVNEINKYIDN